MSAQAEMTGPLVETVTHAADAVRSNSSLHGENVDESFASVTIRGGLYLGLRYGLGVLISLGNMFVLTWWIGPHAYGIFVAAAGLTAFLASLTRSGIDTYLVRRAAAPDERMYQVASTLIAGCALVLVALGAAGAPLLVRWYGSREFVPAYLTMLLTVPLVGLAGPPTAKLERALNFRAVAQIELGGQLLALAVSLTLAWRGLGVWAPVCGHLAWQAFAVAGSLTVARFVPKPRFSLACAREMLAFGVGYTASLRAWQLRTLVNPLLVGRFAGAEGVAFVGLAMRVAEGLGFIRIAAARLAIAALARLQADRLRFRSALEKALKIQVLVLGPLLCAFALLSPLVIPLIMGPRWIPSLVVYPFIASGVLINSIFNLQASALFVIGKQWSVFRAYASHAALLAGVTLFLVPRLGLAGYGWAELAACLGYLFLVVDVSRGIGISYRELLTWVAGFTAPLFAPAVSRGWSLVLCLPLIGIASAWNWKRWRGRKRWRERNSYQGTAGEHAKLSFGQVHHLLTFFHKARQRKMAYVRAVFKYQVRSRTYRLQTELQRLRSAWRPLSMNDESSPARHNLSASLRKTINSARRFHFTVEDIPAIVDSVPAVVQGQAVAEAEKILRQRFFFRGLERTFLQEVDWQNCPQGNVSWNWDLNRHRFFLTLGTAYHYTGDISYLRKMMELWEHWIAHNPAPKAPAWRYPFEVAARLQNWMWAYFLLVSCGQAEPSRLARFDAAIREHARFLHSNLEYHWPNNHLLLEAKTLYEYSLLFPWFWEGASVPHQVEELFFREVEAQSLPDGAHAELCSMYHRIVAGELGEVALLCERLGRPVPPAIQERVDRLIDFSRALVREDGSMPLLGDSALYDTCMRFDFASPTDSDLNYWVWWRRQPGSGHVPSQIEGAPRLRIFHDTGYGFLRGGAGNRGFHLTFDFGPFSRCSSPNHGHCDALSFELYALGRPLIVDPGIYLGWGEDRHWQHYFRSTAAHNTLMIDGREQSELCRYADVRRTASTRLLSHDFDGGQVKVRAECVPYWANGNGIRHIREIQCQSEKAFAIHDEIAGSGRHRLDWFFHFAPEIAVVKDDPAGIVAKLQGEHGEVLRMRASAGQVPHLALARGRTDPLCGWVSRDSARVLPAYTTVYSADVELPFAINFYLELLPASS